MRKNRWNGKTATAECAVDGVASVPLDLSENKTSAGDIAHKARKSFHSNQIPHQRPLPTFLPGHRVARTATGEEGVVEFSSTAADVLVHFGGNPDDLSKLAWVGRNDLRLVDASHERSSERADVRAYRHALQALELSASGVPVEQVAAQLERPEAWVRQRIALGSPDKLAKPRGMEWWDPKGFCEVTYLRKYAREAGLYEEIVQGVEWEQDKVWRVRKEERSDSWHLRTVKECPGRPGHGFCGRSLQKVPDNTHQIGPNDRRVAAKVTPHSNWKCERAEASSGCCQKPSLDSPFVEPYWWCPSCRWYACDACVDEMPDKATSKQVWHWRPGQCPRFDALVADLVRDFALPDPLVAGYTVKMNWYPDALARVSPHRHDNWTLLLSLGSPRVLTVDRARVLMEDGDVILFGTQSHGVPEMLSCEGGRLSVVLMFAPDARVGAMAAARARAAGNGGGRRGEAIPGMEPSRFAPASRQVDNGAGRNDGSEGAVERDPNVAVDAQTLGVLVSLGFHREDAVAALLATNGDADAAAAVLFAAAGADEEA
eukprot:TRINITY_DN26547_c0_g1_i1.p1 TRINITY_DN26547_c0_g1~~TRINITY_DN26547_c0_g1_i1.p1  ORF type:complete len:556 (+),score=52.03 TRINITY_DN26547_c0_g1_i1:41-1669(+)